MVKCSKCGKDNQPEAVYCDNCGIPVYKEQGESLQADYKERMTFLIGVIAAFVLIGRGIFLSLYAANFGMAGSEVIGYVMVVGGIVVLVVAYVMFGRGH